ncbi:MAG: hypothetical protein ABIZ73_07165 [Gemmatimonadaceae bacterium]
MALSNAEGHEPADYVADRINQECLMAENEIISEPAAPSAAIPAASPAVTPLPEGAPAPPRRSPGHRGADVKDTVAEMAAKAHEISLEAGSKMAAAMKDVVNAAAGLSGFVMESARDLVQFMVRRGQMTQDEADKLILQVEEHQPKRKPAAPASATPQKSPASGDRPTPAKPASASAVPLRATASKPASAKPAIDRPTSSKALPARSTPARPAALTKPSAKPAASRSGSGRSAMAKQAAKKSAALARPLAKKKAKPAKPVAKVPAKRSPGKSSKPAPKKAASKKAAVKKPPPKKAGAKKPVKAKRR